MNQQTQKSTTSLTNCSPLIPESIMTANRSEIPTTEIPNLELNIVWGELPKDLQGHVFIVAPVGSIESGGIPFKDGTPILNGDGMIYRFDFNEPGKVRVNAKIVKPPCYYADLATQTEQQYQKYKFGNHGLGRFSICLGLRNELNTALLPMQFSGENARLLVCWDGGRPYEIDTETLEVVTPVGSNKEWQPEAETPLNFVFNPVMSTAHPYFDAKKNQMFSVNFGKSLGILGKIVGLKDFVYLIRWDGKGDLERWKVVLEDGSPVKLQQTMHQITVTDKYVILMETAFLFGVGQMINNPFPKRQCLDKLLRVLLTGSQSPNTVVYIISRADLTAGQYPAQGGPEVTVKARKLVIPREAIHLLADYENPDNQITLHMGHVCAWEGSEWTHVNDRFAENPSEQIPSRVHGMISEETDISYIGRYVIDGETGTMIRDRVIKDWTATWGISFFTYRVNPDTGMMPDRFDNIYWTSLGLWNELLTEFLFKLTKNYAYRTVSPENLLIFADEGVAPCLFRVNISDETIAIADCYQLPEGYTINSPQFVPCGAAEDNSTKGYIVSTVLGPNTKEVWIFDGENLAIGPVCKLSHPSLDFGFTIHTAWLPKIAKRTASYNIPVKQDYQPLVDRKSRQIREMFDKYVYPHFQ
jgi:carotenoid cleavage dioxygenase-like enzyme